MQCFHSLLGKAGSGTNLSCCKVGDYFLWGELNPLNTMDNGIKVGIVSSFVYVGESGINKSYSWQKRFALVFACQREIVKNQLKKLKNNQLPW